MSRNDLVQRLAEAGNSGNKAAVKRTLSALVAEARAQNQHGYAARLNNIMRIEGPSGAERSPRQSMLPEDIYNLAFTRTPKRRLQDLILSEDLLRDLREFIFEHANLALLRANSLEPRHKVLLTGPPGNGKTSLAEAMALELGLEFLIVSYDAIIDSYLGETASRFRRLIDYACSTPVLLFFDEFDAVGKERADTQETGEMRRLVSSLLVQFDQIPSTTVIVCATNHPDLLDSAVWRRFDLRLQLNPPGLRELEEWFRKFNKAVNGGILKAAHKFTASLAGESFSEVEAFALDVRRKIVLSQGRLKSLEVLNDLLDRRAASKGLGVTGGDKQSGASANYKNSPRASRKKAHTGQPEGLFPTEA